MMKTFQAKVYVRNGTSRVPHVVQFNAESSFAAHEMLKAQYGASNVISVPVEIKPGSSYNPSPWMLNIG